MLLAWKDFSSLTADKMAGPGQQLLSWVETRLFVEARLLTPLFRVAVIGRWRQGKTLLINRLVNGEALPTNLLGPFAGRTVVRWADRPAATLYFSQAAGSALLDDWPEEIVSHRDSAGAGSVPPFDLAPSRLAEIPPPSSDQSDLPVDRLEVLWPAELLRDGVELLDTSATNLSHRADGWRDALDLADFVIVVSDGAGAGLTQQDGTLLARKVRDRGHERFAVALTGTDKLGRSASARGLSTVRERSAILAGVPAEWVFPLGLQAMTDETRGQLDRLAGFIRRAADNRSALKARSALLRLQTEALARFGSSPNPPQQAFVERVARLLQDFPLSL